VGIHTPLLNLQGRLDVSAHPFTGETHPTDVRMTTRFKEGCLMEGLQGAIHETGHALYEQVRFTHHVSCEASIALGFGVQKELNRLCSKDLPLVLDSPV
jgi:carboxypeptidase Taq